MDKLRHEYSKKIVVNGHCPFIGNPADDCYCVKLESRTIAATIHYCGGNFIKCEIYKRLSNKTDEKIGSS